MNREKEIIGRTEYVWITVTGQKKVPARIDTGARTTAIWASNITERNGVLSWEFFAPKSVFWTGKIFHIKNFDRRIVMSSTGHQETRYLIPLTLQIRKRRVRTYCTLADRAHSTFPVLVGRNTLSGKFVVDVSHGSRKLSELYESRYAKLQSSIERKKQ
jgi:hypothetical protein